MTPAERVLKQIDNSLKLAFDGQIDLSDVATQSKSFQADVFRSRALAALYVYNAAGISTADAAKHVTDGGDDEGVDAVFLDQRNKQIHLVQSKWRKKPNKGFALDEWLKFREGVEKLIRLDFKSFNKKIKALKADFTKILEDIDCTVQGIIIQTTTTATDKKIQTAITEFVEEQNKINEFLNIRHVHLPEISKMAKFLGRPSAIDLEVMLRHWGELQEPYRAFYGAVGATEVASWSDSHGEKLFAENLRGVLEKSDVNKTMLQTLLKNPEYFWYFNNGVSIICQKVQKTAAGGNSRESGVFRVKSASVINGAQTVGSIAEANRQGANLNSVFVPLRIISLEGAPDDFGIQVTRSNNNQNQLTPIDFVALDRQQERIKTELALMNLTYSYKRGDPPLDDAKGFDLRTATLALACAASDLGLAVAAKRYISGLWEDISKEPYTVLFNDDLDVKYLWNLVQLFRSLDRSLNLAAKERQGRARLVSVHANRFLIHCVLNSKALREVGTQLEFNQALEQECVDLGVKCLELLIELADAKFPDSYPGNIFKNAQKQGELKAALAGKLPEIAA